MTLPNIIQSPSWKISGGGAAWKWHIEVGAEVIAEGDETAAGVAGAWFDDDGGLGVAEDVEEVGFADGVEFSEDVADEDHAWG